MFLLNLQRIFTLNNCLVFENILNKASRVKKVEYGELPDVAPPIPVPSPASSYPKSAKWIDATTELRSAAVKQGTGVVEGDWLRVDNRDKQVLFTLADGHEFRDVAVRVTFSHGAMVFLRNTKNSRYSGGSGSSGATSIESYQSSGPQKGNVRLINGRTVANYDGGIEHEFVFAARGDQLTTWLDGIENASVRDAIATAGALNLNFWAAANAAAQPRIKKVEYAELPDSTSADHRSKEDH